MAVILCVSCTQELRNLMKERAISPSLALKIGVMKIVAEPYIPEKGVVIVKTEANQRLEMQNAMQARINELNTQIKKLEGKNVV